MLCVCSYDNCLLKKGQCTHLKLLFLFNVQPRSQEPWKRGCNLMTNCGYSKIKQDLFTYVGVLMQTIPSKVKKSDFNRSAINTVKQGTLAAFNKMTIHDGWSMISYSWFRTTVKPRYNEGPRDCGQNLFAFSRFFFTYFTITGVKKIFRYTEVFVIDKVRYIEDQLYSNWN